jgi:hypothetical protein
LIPGRSRDVLASRWPRCRRRVAPLDRWFCVSAFRRICRWRKVISRRHVITTCARSATCPYPRHVCVARHSRLRARRNGPGASGMCTGSEKKVRAYQHRRLRCAASDAPAGAWSTLSVAGERLCCHYFQTARATRRKFSPRTLRKSTSGQPRSCRIAASWSKTRGVASCMGQGAA